LLTPSPTRLHLLVLTGLALFHVPAFASCEALATLQLPHTTITKAELVAAGKFLPTTGKPLPDLPAFCRVTATLKPSPDSDIRIEIWMPQSGWNERFNGTGNGGFAGNISYNALAEGLRRGYAVANTDMGMSTPPGATASIFINRPERWMDWGYRATHEMTLVAKQIVRAYYARGHKLLLYHGWADWLVAPGETIDYYNSVLTRAKDDPTLDQSVRLFMVPGMSHCSGGPGATHFDALGAMVEWVEHGAAPDKIIASTLPPTDTTGAVNTQRPLCPYPRTAEYQGSGSTNDAANFVCTVR